MATRRARREAGDLDPTFCGDGRVALPAAGSFVPRAVGVDGRTGSSSAGYRCEPDPPSRDGTCLADGDASLPARRA